MKNRAGRKNYSPNYSRKVVGEASLISYRSSRPGMAVQPRRVYKGFIKGVTGSHIRWADRHCWIRQRKVNSLKEQGGPQHKPPYRCTACKTAEASFDVGACASHFCCDGAECFFVSVRTKVSPLAHYTCVDSTCVELAKTVYI
jgi:hypothetical protein